MPTVSSCSTQICKVLVFLLQSDVDPHIETRGIRGLWGIYSFMYIIIYIINYNEYIVMYNIESHSLTITSTTWLNNVPHWYTNCKCTDKKALDEVNEALKVAYAQRALIPSLYTFFLNLHIYIFISRITSSSLFDFLWAYLYIYTSKYVLR